jgi:uncharacterized protein YbjT (DUF2867 family)
LRILVLGATGFIGSAAVARLLASGHRVLAVARPGSRRAPADGQDWLEIDIARATRESDWTPHLAGVDAVLNCSGVFQDSMRDSTAGVHAEGPAALYEACAKRGVRRVVHISAIGAGDTPLSPFSETKGQGERALMALDLDWVILRPSVVLGRDAYGSGALFRGLAALPWLPLIPGAGPLQPVWIDDLTRTVLRLIEPDAPARLTLEIVGPERMSMAQIVQRYRAWLGWPPAREIQVPAWLLAPAYRLGDAAGRLGWRPPIRSNARREMARGAVGDPRPWMAATGLRPTALGQALAREPAPVQERWYARLYLLRPLLLAVLSGYWMLTGVVSLGPGWDRGVEMLDGTAAAGIAPIVVMAGALADVAIGAAIAFRRSCRAGLWGGIAVTLAYAIAGTVLRPQLWADPLGAMLKIGPILVLMLVALAILEER